MINQSSVERMRKLSRVLLATVIVVLFTITYFATTAFAGMLGEYNVTIVDGDDTIAVTTNETAAFEILEQNAITIGPEDKVDISAFESGKGGTIVIQRLKSVNIDFEGNISTYEVYAETVKEAMEEIGIVLSENDTVNFDMSEAVTDGMVIRITSPRAVSLIADGKTSSYLVTDGTVADLLATAGIALGEDDTVTPSVDTQLKAGLQIIVQRVEYKTEVKTETLKYTTKTISDSSLARGKTKTVTKGENGLDKVTYLVKYVDGEAVEMTEQARETVKEPTQKVVKIGTKAVTSAQNGVTSSGSYSVGDVISGHKTHYCACKKCNGSSSTGTTASGMKVYNGMADPYIVACNWLPLGSVIEVDGVQYTVADRGGSSLSTPGRIDIFTPAGHQACIQKGAGSCTIKIVRLGW